MDEETIRKTYERVGILLIAVVLILIGLILLKDRDESTATFVPAPEPVNTETTVKSAETVKAGLVSINKASLEDLDRLPGIGPVLAQRIIDYRTKNGGFKSLDQLKDVSGIGDAKFGNVKNLISL